MKSILILFVCIFYLFSCDPPRDRLTLRDKVSIKTEVSDTNEILHIGDTLTLYFRIPQNAETASGPLFIQSIMKNSVVYDLTFIDTIQRTTSVVYYRQNNAAIRCLLTKGTFVTNESYSAYITQVPPYEFEMKFIMMQKGVYYFSVARQAFLFGYNNDRIADLFINFNHSNKHISILGKYLGSAFEQAALQNDRLGFGTYAFRVQ